LHRPSNVDSKEYLIELIDTLNAISKIRKLIFPIHPRTKDNIRKFQLESLLSNNIILTDPIGYIDFLALSSNAELIITDSGGIQEESTFLGVQCITVRNNTERPSTVEIGTNHLIGTDLSKVKKAALEVLKEKIKTGSIPPLWDGMTSERITKIIVESFNR